MDIILKSAQNFEAIQNAYEIYRYHFQTGTKIFGTIQKVHKKRMDIILESAQKIFEAILKVHKIYRYHSKVHKNLLRLS